MPPAGRAALAGLEVDLHGGLQPDIAVAVTVGILAIAPDDLLAEGDPIKRAPEDGAVDGVGVVKITVGEGVFGLIATISEDRR